MSDTYKIIFHTMLNIRITYALFANVTFLIDLSMPTDTDG